MPSSVRTMNACLQSAERDRLAPMVRKTFRAWRLLEDGLEPNVAQCVEARGDTLSEVTAYFVNFGAHKWKYAVEETDAITGDITLRHYVIQRGRWQGRYERGAYGDYAPRKACPLNASLLTTQRINAPFDPKLKYQWTPDADVIGGDGVINARCDEKADAEQWRNET